MIILSYLKSTNQRHLMTPKPHTPKYFSKKVLFTLTPITQFNSWRNILKKKNSSRNIFTIPKKALLTFTPITQLLLKLTWRSEVNSKHLRTVLKIHKLSSATSPIRKCHQHRKGERSLCFLIFSFNIFTCGCFAFFKEGGIFGWVV